MQCAKVALAGLVKVEWHFMCGKEVEGLGVLGLCCNIGQVVLGPITASACLELLGDIEAVDEDGVTTLRRRLQAVKYLHVVLSKLRQSVR